MIDQDAADNPRQPAGRLEDQEAPETARDYDGEYLSYLQLQEYEQQQRELAEVLRVSHFLAAFHAQIAPHVGCLLDEEQLAS